MNDRIEAIVLILAHAFLGRCLANEIVRGRAANSTRATDHFDEGEFVRGGCYGGFETSIVMALVELGYTQGEATSIMWEAPEDVLNASSTLDEAVTFVRCDLGLTGPAALTVASDLSDEDVEGFDFSYEAPEADRTSDEDFFAEQEVMEQVAMADEAQSASDELQALLAHKLGLEEPFPRKSGAPTHYGFMEDIHGYMRHLVCGYSNREVKSKMARWDSLVDEGWEAHIQNANFFIKRTLAGQRYSDAQWIIKLSPLGRIILADALEV